MTQCVIAFSITGKVKVCGEHGYSIIGDWVKHTDRCYEIWIKGGKHLLTNDKVGAYIFCIRKYAELNNIPQETYVEMFRNFMEGILEERKKYKGNGGRNMKANELMIGDWVFMDGIPHQLSDINLIAVWLSDEKRLNTMDFKPIPLTEEILNVNSKELETNGVSYGDCHMEETKWFCYIKDTDVYCYELQWKFNYVHELQHALRLCGLNELADNFKIE